MAQITLYEFQKMTSLSDRALVEALHRRLLPCSVSPEGEIMVDVTGIGENTLLQALLGQHATVSDEECALLKEKCSHILREELNSVIEQVILELSTAASSRGS